MGVTPARFLLRRSPGNGVRSWAPRCHAVAEATCGALRACLFCPAMQSGAVGLNWVQVAGVLAALGLIFVTFFCLKRLKQRRREESGERPPQREKVLRPAGYSAMCRMDDLAEELVSAVIQAAGAGMVFGVIVATFSPLLTALALGKFTLAQMWAMPGSDLLVVAALLALIALLCAVRAFQRVWKIDSELRNWRFGMRGEQAVAEKLADRGLAAAGYVAFHDVPGDGKWNVDHVVVGPGGVLVLETKTRARRRPTRDQQEQDVGMGFDRRFALGLNGHRKPWNARCLEK
jgi:hypothetical protein